MSKYIGDFLEDATLSFTFPTVDKNGGMIAPSAAFDAADVQITRLSDGAIKATNNGITVTSPYQSKTGRHRIEINTSNDTGEIAGFWGTGHDYEIALITAKTIDSESIDGAPIRTFSIENRSDKVSTVTGSVGSVAGSVGSVTGSVNVGLVEADAIRSTSFEDEALTANKIAEHAFTSDKFSNGFLTSAKIATGVFDAIRDAVFGAVVSTLTVAGSIGNQLRLALTGITSQLAQKTDVDGLSNFNTVTWNLGTSIERVDSGSKDLQLKINVFDPGTLALKNADTTPAITITDGDGTGDRSAEFNLSAVTNPSTGVYLFTITNATTLTLEPAIFEADVTVDGLAFPKSQVVDIVDLSVVGFAQSDRDVLSAVSTLLNDGTFGNSALKTLIDAVQTSIDGGVSLSLAERSAVADAILSRGVANVEDTADVTSLAGLILATFESDVSGTTWTIRKTAGGVFVSKTLTVDANADPVIGVT